MQINKYTNYIQIEGLEEHSQAYDENSFLLKRLDGSSVLFLLEIVSPFEVELNFMEEVPEEVLIVTININNKSVSMLAQNKVEEIKPEPEPIKEELEYHFEEKNIVIENKGDFRTGDIAIKMKKYSLERYDDFPDETIIIDIPIDFYTSKDRKIPFEIERDYIYRITTRFRENTKTVDYIYDRPTCYFSSIYHIKQLASNFDLYINEMKLTEFDLKLLIWKYSNIAVSIAGITGDVIYQHKNSLLNDYVGQRALLDVVTQAIREVNLNPDIAKESLGSIAVTLADLSHGAATTETVTTQLVRVHKELYGQVKDLEKNLRNYFTYLQAHENLENKDYKGREVRRRTDFNPKIKRGKRY